MLCLIVDIGTRVRLHPVFQLLGDYDKVKTVSSGSDCVCRCIVRPIPRSHCSGLPSPSGDSYSVETVTKGTDCKKCVCMAPPSAVNPCEGEYRFKKLQEAGKEDIKVHTTQHACLLLSLSLDLSVALTSGLCPVQLATIIELLEGSLYGMDLLKLHSVTTKLLSRVDNVEKVSTHANRDVDTHTTNTCAGQSSTTPSVYRTRECNSKPFYLPSIFQR